jgi:hypothetical protein
MISIELEDRTAEALHAQARARNLPLDSYLKQIASTATPLNASAGMPADDFDLLLHAVAGDHPSLPAAFSRADIYTDHD